MAEIQAPKAPAKGGYRFTKGKSHQHFAEEGLHITLSLEDLTPKMVEGLQKTFARVYGPKDGAARLAQLIEPIN